MEKIIIIFVLFNMTSVFGQKNVQIDSSDISYSIKFMVLQGSFKTINKDMINVIDSIINKTSCLEIKKLKSKGFNNVDLDAAKKYNLKVCRVPAYSPQAVAEHAMAMILTLNRKTHKAYNRVREQNFSLNGLLGFDLFGKTIGIIGTGNIGKAFAKIAFGFGCKVLAYDIVSNAFKEWIGTQEYESRFVSKCAFQAQ